MIIKIKQAKKNFFKEIFLSIFLIDSNIIISRNEKIIIPVFNLFSLILYGSIMGLGGGCLRYKVYIKSNITRINKIRKIYNT